MTASIGVADNTSPEIDSPKALIKAADEALYIAKFSARNQTELYYSVLGEIKEADDFVIDKKAFLLAIRNNLLFLNMKDHYTYGHVERVVNHVSIIGREFLSSPRDIRDLKIEVVLHDIGKVYLPSEILNKTGPLSPEEWEVMKKHPEYGILPFSAFSLPSSIMDVVLYHHERYDGKGYPKGLRGEQIPLLARVVSVVDAFDAMTVDRPYRKALTQQEALKELERNKGTQFDPIVVECFTETIKKRLK